MTLTPFFFYFSLKMRHRDPRLFYLSMEVAVRRAGVKTILVLDEDTRPAIMQACHPKGESRFCLQLKPGGLIRVHTSALQPSSQYKSLVISEETNCDELLQLLLSCYSSLEPVENFSLYEVCPGQECQRKLHPDDLPLRAQAERMRRGESCHFLVRRTPNYARRRQLLANLNEAINQSYESSSTGTPSTPSDRGVQDVDTVSLLEMSLESELSLSEDLRSCSSSSEDAEDEDECASSSGSSDNSTECALRRDFFQPRVTPTHTPTPTSTSTTAISSGQANSQSGSCSSSSVASSPSRAYSPVYNIREIRTSTHSFSSLGKDKKLLDIHMNARYAPAGVYTRLLPVAEVDSIDVNGNPIATSTNTSSLSSEAVNNNPAKGLGHFVYL